MQAVVLTLLMLYTAWIDTRTHCIPDWLCLSVALTAILHFRGVDAVLGLGVAILFIVVALPTENGIGGGDIKLVAALGFSLGLLNSVAIVLIALITFLIVYRLVWRDPSRAYPLGAFFAAGTIVVLWMPILFFGRNV